MLLFHRIQCPPHVPFLVVLGVIARATANCHPQPIRMREIPMAALAAPVHKSSIFQVGYQLSHFARHFSINVVSHLSKAVKCGQVWRVTSGSLPMASAVSSALKCV